jgi:hypothetical protein
MQLRSPMDRPLASLVLALLAPPLTARADTSIQVDAGLIDLVWARPPSVSTGTLRSAPIDEATKPSLANAFAVRTAEGGQFGIWRVGLGIDFGPPILAWRADGMLAPRLGPLRPQLGLSAGVGYAFSADSSPGVMLAYVNGQAGARLRLGGDVDLGATVERSIVATRSYWIVGLSIGGDIDITQHHATATVAAPVNPALDEELKEALAEEAAAEARYEQTVAAYEAAVATEHATATVWASSVLDFSSQYSATSWSARQALGPPDVYPASGDRTAAWASANADGGPEFIELGFVPHRVRAVEIYETFHPGAVSRVTLRDATRGARQIVFDGGARPVDTASYRRRVEFDCTDGPIDAVRVDLDSTAISGWNEIDAIGVVPCD